MQWASAEELVNGSLLLKCGFADGSLARGCQLTLQLSLSGKVRIILRLQRSEGSSEVWGLYDGAIEWGTAPYLMASDIEQDGETGLIQLEGNITLLTTVTSGLCETTSVFWGI